MGKRIHVATTYKVSYQESPSIFNWQIEQFPDLLNALDVNYSGAVCDNEFAIDADEFQQVVHNLMDENYDNREEVLECLKAFDYTDYTPEECAGDLQKYLDAADIEDGWLQFSCF